MKTAAIYARVSSDKQREENTIASQTAALVAFAREQQFEVPQEWIFEDDGYSGASLIRPGLERVCDLAAEGLIQAVLIYAPDRLSRRYTHQILLIEELARAGVETLFVRAPRGSTPEEGLSAAISFASARASINACRTCGGANRRTTLNCKRLSISQSIAQPTCASLKR